jgi:hypothetical protein
MNHSRARSIVARCLLAALALGALVASTACGPPPPPAGPTEKRDYPCTLHVPAELSPEFMVRQHVEAAAYGRSGGFDAVLQKKDDALVVVGLVGGVRAFVLKQSGEAITFEQSFGPPLPFPPRNVIIDIHRAFWKRLPVPADAKPTETRTGDLDDEKVEERWENGNLKTRAFMRPDWKGKVLLTYGPGCTQERCTPKSIRIDNQWYAYTLTIENGEFTPL